MALRQFLNDTYPRLSHATSDVVVELGQQRWEVAWPHTLSTRSQAAPRWGGGAVLSLVPEAADAPSELVELLPDGSVQRFALGDEAVHVLLPDGSAVVWRDDQLVRLSPPQPADTARGMVTRADGANVGAADRLRPLGLALLPVRLRSRPTARWSPRTDGRDAHVVRG